MSTILDALRKLQRERAAANPPRDLRGSVTDSIHAPRPAQPSSRRGLALGALATLLLAGAGGAAWLYRDRVTGLWGRSGSAEIAQEDDGADAQFSPEEMAEVARKEREADERDAAEASASGAAPAQPQVAAAPESPPQAAAAPEVAPDPSQEAELAAERARLEAVQAEAALAAQRQAEAEAAARAAAAPPAPVTPPVTESAPSAQAQAAAPPAESRVAPAPPPVPTRAAAPKPKARAKAKPKSQPAVAKAEPPRESLDEPVTSGLPAFPPVRVESIRWHPIAERRVASLKFEQQNVSDAHEGDIVGGVLVYRIDPGAVEIRIGSTSRVIRPTP